MLITAMQQEKKSIENMQTLAKEKGGRCLSKEYWDDFTELKWQCNEGHTWDMAPFFIKNGAWCPMCSTSNMRRLREKAKTLKKFKTIAIKKGGLCLAEEYNRLDTKVTWQCAKGHQWIARFDSIKNGTWCQECKKDKLFEELKQIADLQGGQCLSMHYDYKNKMRWKCKKGHIWETHASNIKSGNWCPVCNGPPVYTIEDIQKIAKSKGGECLSKNYGNAFTKLRFKCKMGHKWKAISRSIVDGKWCIVCAGKQKYTIKQMREFAKAKGGKCLSKEYVNALSPLKWECDLGHTWKAKPSRIVMGSWCLHCTRKRHGDRTRGTIEQMNALAKAKGGKCISEVYVNSQTKLEWECAKGHQWKSTPAQINKGTWCPKCRVRKPKYSIDFVKQLAEKKGGRLLSKKFTTLNARYSWECKNGHRWETQANIVRNGSWCRKCYFEGRRKRDV